MSIVMQGSRPAFVLLLVLSMMYSLPSRVYALDPMLIFAVNAPVYGGDCSSTLSDVLAGRRLA